MASLTIENIPAELLDCLRTLAKAEGRTLSHQVLVLLEEALERDGGAAPGSVERQIDAWRRLAGRWPSQGPSDGEIRHVYATRSRGRETDA